MSTGQGGSRVWELWVQSTWQNPDSYTSSDSHGSSGLEERSQRELWVGSKVPGTRELSPGPPSPPQPHLSQPASLHTHPPDLRHWAQNRRCVSSLLPGLSQPSVQGPRDSEGWVGCVQALWET